MQFLTKLSLFITCFSLFSTASVKAQTIIPTNHNTHTPHGKGIAIDGGTLSQDSIQVEGFLNAGASDFQQPEPKLPDPNTLQRDPISSEQEEATVPPSSQIEVFNLEQAQDILQKIEGLTGVQPALIYVNFTPPTLTGTTDFQRQEALAIKAYEEYFDVPQQEASPILSIEPQPSDQLELLIVTESGDPLLITVEGATREEVTTTAENLYSLTSNPPSPFEVQTQPYLKPAQQLYDWLLEPLEATLSEQEIDNLVFIMPSGLRLLPLATLHDGEKFLVEQYSVGLLPSLSWSNPSYKNIQDLEVFATGASNFADPTSLEPLPAVETELRSITDIWPGEFAINKEFTIENFRKERRQGIVHLATHADFRAGNPDQIYLQFYDEKIRLNDLGKLNLNDPPVELLILSACRTAVGNEQVELGFAGLTIQAGVNSALASLWYVGDTATLGLMSQFYQELNTAPIKAEAIRQAQLNFIQGKVRLEEDDIITPRGSVSLPSDVSKTSQDLTHPYYWSGFTMVGSPW